jgi:uncharacterized protein
MEGTFGTCGGNRRRFLTTAAGAALALSDRLAPAAPPPSPIPTVTLGRTGQKVTRLGMGTSWSIDQSFVQAALFAGVRYIDTSETYENTRVERVLGQVIERTGLRKDVYLVTKNAAYRRATGPAAARVFEQHLVASLERLRTDHVDAYYMHGLAGDQIDMLHDSGVRAAFESLKKSGKIRFCGLSCHDARLPEILEAAAEVGWIDQVMFKYNYRDVGKKDRYDHLNRAIDKVHKANIGLVAMKTQSGAEPFPADKAELEAGGVKVKGPLHPSEQRIVDLLGQGVKREVAAIKTVWLDERMQVAVSEMTTRSDLRENVAASRAPLTVKEARLLEEHRRATEHLYCHGCGHLCETAARGVPVATVLRYYRYYSVYGKRAQARALYQALPPEARPLADADFTAAEAACPYGLPVAALLRQADRRLSSLS